MLQSPNLVRTDLMELVDKLKNTSNNSKLMDKQLYQSLLYYEYGLRRDRTHLQKIAMFDVLYNISRIQPGKDITCYCINFSDDQFTVIELIKWFCNHGIKIGEYDLLYSFHKFGTSMFWFFGSTLLKNNDAIPYTLQAIIRSKTQTIAEKKIALQWFKQRGVFLDTYIFSAGCIVGDLNFCKWLLELGVKIGINNFNYLVFESDQPDFHCDAAKNLAIDLYLKIEFVQKCLHLIIPRIQQEISVVIAATPEYTNRANYAFGGQIYDWLIATYSGIFPAN